MNARSYKVNLILSPFDFPSIIGLGESSVSYQSEPFLINNKVRLTITKKYILLDMSTNQEHEVLSVESVYEIPCNEIKSRGDVYEFYKDATLSLNEAYKIAQMHFPSLANRTFSNQPIESYKGEIDRVFSLLISQN